MAALQHDTIDNHLIKHALDGMTLSKELTFKDKLDHMKIRLGISRDEYMIKPGLYKIGHPTETSNVLVTCNYKLTVDIVRSSLKKDYFLLILDTDGINVWCAAGKGKFGTAELIYALQHYGLESHVSHKNLIVPQLGAPGIQAHLVTQVTGYKIKYGPIRIEDVDLYTDDYIKTKEMSKVEFTLKERLVLTPLEFKRSFKLILPVLLLSLLPVLNLSHVVMLLISAFMGTIVFPAILPVRPFKMFYKNGILLSMIANLYLLYNDFSLFTLGFYMLVSMYCGFLALNFTGSTTFTSLSGVEKEMNIAIKFIINTSVISGIVMVLGVFI